MRAVQHVPPPTDRDLGISAALAVPSFVFTLGGSLAAFLTGATTAFWIPWFGLILLCYGIIGLTFVWIWNHPSHTGQHLPFIASFSSGHTDTAERAEELLTGTGTPEPAQPLSRTGRPGLTAPPSPVT